MITFRTPAAMIVALSTSVTASVELPTKFDMICTGTQVEVDGRNSIKGPAEPVRYTVDLDRNLWCGVGCRQPQAISKVTLDTITLSESRHAMLDVWIAVNRVSGAFSASVIVHPPKRPQTGRIIEGECKHAPFSGLPEKRF